MNDGSLVELSMNRRSPEEVLGGLLSKERDVSARAGLALLDNVRSYGVSMKDYLTLAIQPKASTSRPDIAKSDLSGFEAALAYLNLPTQNNFKEGIVLQAAAQTFATYDGTRAMFPEVLDTMLRWQDRLFFFESTPPIVASSKTVVGAQLIMAIVSDGADGQDVYRSSTVSEGGQVPVRSVQTTQTTVSFFKHGSGYEVSYEFLRRAQLDILTPFAARVQRLLEVSKVANVTNLLINGYGTTAHPAATVKKQQADYSGGTGTLNYGALLSWFADRAKAGVPVDTVVGNFAMYMQWLKLFYVPLQTSGSTGIIESTGADAMAKAGFAVGRLPILDFNVQFAISSQMPNNQLMGITKAETVEELVEAGSLIAEADRAIRNQTVTYVRSENVGYRLTFGDTRQIYDISQ